MLLQDNTCTAEPLSFVRPVGVCPEEDHKDDPWAAAPILQTEMEKDAVLHSGEQKALGMSHCSLLLNMKKKESDLLHSNRIRQNDFKLK